MKEVSWKNIRDTIVKVEPKLAELIDEINPEDSLKLIIANYHYGDLIFKDGNLQVPDENGNVLPLANIDINNELKEKLAYSPIPLFLVLENCNEVFIDTGSRIIPLDLFYPGSLLGLFEATDYVLGMPSRPKWSVTAGARSVFMLPKINESLGLKKLRLKYSLNSQSQLHDLTDHFHVFKEIANSNNFKQVWQNSVMFFTKEWLECHDHDPAWVKFHNYLFKHSWQQAQFAIGKIELGLLWETFADAIAARRLKPSPFLADQVKHIMLIASGKWPGFRPADQSQQIAPILGLQTTFVEDYGLKQYLPTIMHPISFTETNSLAIYYSLAFPTLLEGTPRNKNTSSTIMFDLREMKMLLNILLSSFDKNKKFHLNVFDDVALEYFHVEPDMFEEVKLSKIIAEDDNGFLSDTINFPDRIFCNTSPFWRGCIRITQHKRCL